MKQPPKNKRHQNSVRAQRNSLVPFSRQSFSLIELLLVVIFLGIIAGLAIPNFGPSFFNLQLKETASNIAYLMQYAQSRSIIKNKLVRIEFDEQNSSYRLWESKDGEKTQEGKEVFEKISGRLGRPFQIPREVAFTASTRTIQFYPDGKIDKARIDLSNKQERYFTISTEQQIGSINTFDFKLP